MKRTEGMLSASWRGPSLKLGSQLSVSKADAAVVLFRKCQRRDAAKPDKAAVADQSVGRLLAAAYHPDSERSETLENIPVAFCCRLAYLY